MASALPGAERRPVRWIHGDAIGRGTRAGADGAAGHGTAAARRRRSTVDEEVRRLEERVVLRLLVCEAQAVVERHPVVHLPVVLQEPLDVLVAKFALDELRLLRVAREHAERGVGVAEAGVERVVGVVVEDSAAR